MKPDAESHSLFRNRLVRSFGYAIRGIGYFFRFQANARIHLAAAVFVTMAGFWLEIPTGNWIVLILAMGLVLMAEAMNSALEWLADAIHPDHHPLVGRAKDVAAGGVLIAAVAAALVGILVFWAPLFDRISPAG